MRSVAAVAEPEVDEAAPMAVENLVIEVGSRRILKGITASFAANAVTAIIGPTGCGKTTLLRSLNRLHDGSPGLRLSGRVRLDDTDVYENFGAVRELRRRVGMVFQRPNPFPQSILENVTIGPRVHGLVPRQGARDRAEEMLTRVGLWSAVKDRLNSSPFLLSGGQQQLLCIARALSVDPQVLLLDEPTSSLDPNTTAEIERLIRSLTDRMTVIMVSHNLGQVIRLADHVLFLMAGEKIEFNDARTFFASPSDPRTAEYISSEVGRRAAVGA